MKGTKKSMNCLDFKVKTKKKDRYFYCKLHKKKIELLECRYCEFKQFKKIKPIKRTNKKKSKRAKSTNISQKVKETVFLRDDGRCVICGNSQNVMPNAHYISRQNGGLGIEENIVTLCTELTENKCHRKYDFGTKEEQEYCKEKIKNYLKSKYPDWKEENLVYKKYERGNIYGNL